MMRIDAGSRPRYAAIFYFLSRYKRLYGAILVVTLAGSVFESISVAAFFPVFAALLADSQEETGGILGFITSIADLLPFSAPLVSASVLLITIFVIKISLNLLREVMTAYASAKVLYNVKKQTMDRYAGAHYQFFLDSKQGTLIYNVLAAPGAVAGLLLKGPQMVALLLKTLAITVVLATIFPMAALALVVLGLVYYGVIHYLSGKVSFHLGRGRVRTATDQTIIATEFLSGIRQIMTFHAFGQWLERFDRENRTNSILHAKIQMWNASPKHVMELSAVALMLGFLLVLWFFSPGTFTDALPRLGIFAVSLVQLLPALTSFGRTRMEIMATLPDAEIAYQTVTGPAPTRKEGDTVLESFDKAIAFENVSYAHKERDTLLKDINLTFEKGQVTAIVGPSGSGKTTMVSLILGLFEPTAGSITVDAIPLQELKQETWLSKIGFVSQDPFTYHSTIADNILFGRNGHSMETLVKATSIANAHDFILEFPEGYDTIVGDRGMKLSGGQQQRLAIARAVLDSPEILIFDEATSSLDTLSEQLVQEAIDKVSSDRTVIIIAHRLSTIRHADKIIVIDDGQVVEQGSHQELLSRHGHYSRMVAVNR